MIYIVSQQAMRQWKTSFADQISPMQEYTSMLFLPRIGETIRLVLKDSSGEVDIYPTYFKVVDILHDPFELDPAVYIVVERHAASQN